MASDWKEVILDDVLMMSKAKIDSKDIDIESYVSTDNMLPDFGGVTVAEKLPSASKFTAYKAEDILFSNIRTYFRKLWIANKDGGCSNDVIVFKAREGINPSFGFYSLMNEEFIQYTVQTSKGTKMPRGDKEAMKIYPLSLPPLTEQKAIAHILGSLDDKIELNRQMNETLEAMAQALFKSWFVDFDPVIDNALAAGNAIPEVFAKRAEQRKAIEKKDHSDIQSLFPDEFKFTEEMGWIPKGWESVKLDKLLEVKYGKDHKKLDEGTIPVYGSGGLMRHVNKSLYIGESILIPRKGTLSNLMFVDEEFWTVDTMFFSIPKFSNIAKYIFHHLKLLDLTSMNVGSAVPSMTTKVLNDLDILYPCENTLKEFNRLVTDFYNRSSSLNSQNETLAKLRDTLLPKLMSGELRIADAAALVDEAI